MSVFRNDRFIQIIILKNSLKFIWLDVGAILYLCFPNSIHKTKLDEKDFKAECISRWKTLL